MKNEYIKCLYLFFNINLFINIYLMNDRIYFKFEKFKLIKLEE